MAPSQRCIELAVQAALNQVGSPDSIVCRESWKKRVVFLFSVLSLAQILCPGKSRLLCKSCQACIGIHGERVENYVRNDGRSVTNTSRDHRGS